MRINFIWSPAPCLIAILTLACTLWSAPSVSLEQQNPTPNRPKPKWPPLTSHVVMISISGLRSDFADKPDQDRLKIPTLRALREAGTYAIGVESVYPSQSLPAQASIVTGLLPADHNITSDYAFDDQTGLPSLTAHNSANEIKGDTIWKAAKRDGLVTATIGYPLTAGAAVGFNLTEVLKGNKRFLEFENNSASQQIPTDILNEVKLKSEAISHAPKSALALEIALDEFKAEVSAQLITKYSPNLLLINFTSFDLAQRHDGILSASAKSVLETIDKLIQKILTATVRAKLREETTFLLFSDRGLSQIEHEFKPNALLAQKGLLNLDEQGKIKSWRAVAQSFGGSAAIFIKNPRDEATLREIEAIFTGLEKGTDNPLWRLLSRRDALRLGCDPHASLYLDAAPRFAFSSQINGSLMERAEDHSASGYLPSRAETRGVLIIAGKGVKAKQRIEYARLIDIAPTVARFLGLELKSSRGRVLSEVVTQ